MQIIRAAYEATAAVIQGLEGRVADRGISLPALCCMVAAGRNGDHVEIGTSYGASAIAVALTKKALGYSGEVYCVDPFPDRLAGAQKAVNLPSSIADNPEKLEAAKKVINSSPEIVQANADKLGVKLTIIPKPSFPWPEELKDKEFSTAYIDGWHANEAPWDDFQNLRDRVTKYIAFDNYEEDYPAVMSAVHRAVSTGQWAIYFKNMVFVALRRPAPVRAMGVDVLSL